MKLTPSGKVSWTVTLVAGSGPLLLRVMVYVIVSPTFGRGVLTVLATTRSARCGVSVAVPVLFPVFGSNWSLWPMLAVLVWAAGLSTRARIWSVWGVAGVTRPTVHTPVAGSKAPL